MRKIGEIEQADRAAVFSDYLYTQGIASTVERTGAGGGEIWVHDETSLAAAREALSAFLEDPGNARYADVGKVVEERRREQKRQETGVKRHVHDRHRVFRGGFWRGVPITRLLIILSVAATVFGGLGTGARLTQWLSITEYTVGGEGGLVFDPALPEIARGQIWRLLTPIFLHAALAGGFGFLHLLFNMLWLRDLGGMLENAQGAFGLLHKVVVIGLLSNLLQFALGHNPAFGGMSGVVFGLLGYVWARGRLDLTSGLYVHSQTMMMMMFWFFLCLTGRMGAIANGAHVGGLVSGMVWGWLAAWRVNTRR
jgi:GlpG protein